MDQSETPRGPANGAVERTLCSLLLLCTFNAPENVAEPTFPPAHFLRSLSSLMKNWLPHTHPDIM
jgi:hypothetical protein